MALRLFVLLACTYLLLCSREPPWADAHVVYDTAQSIVQHGELSVELPGPPQFFSFHNGHKYGVFPLGNVLAMVPSYVAFALLSRTRLFPREPLFTLCSHLSPALLMAGAGAMLYRLLRRRGASSRLAALLALGCGLSTICFSYGRVPYSEALQSLFVLLLAGETLAAATEPAAGRMLRIGIYAGVLFNSKLVNALLLPLVPIYIAWQQAGLAPKSSARGFAVVKRLVGPFLLALASFAPFVGLALWHNRVKTGSLWDTGYQIPHGVFSGDLLAGLYGFLLSTGKSVFLYSPPLALLPFAIGTAWRKQRAETVFLSAIVLVALLWNAKFRHWHGDYCWGPRHLVPFVPIAMLLLVPWLPEALERGRTLLRRRLVGLLFGLGFCVQLLGAAFYWDHYIRILIAMKDQTGAGGWFQEQLGHGHYIPQFSPLRGHLWLLEHKLRGDSDLNRDAPWKLIVPQPVDLSAQYQALRFDFWPADFATSDVRRKFPAGLPILLALLGAGLLFGGIGLRRRLKEAS